METPKDITPTDVCSFLSQFNLPLRPDCVNMEYATEHEGLVMVGATYLETPVSDERVEAFQHYTKTEEADRFLDIRMTVEKNKVTGEQRIRGLIAYFAGGDLDEVRDVVTKVRAVAHAMRDIRALAAACGIDLDA